VHFWKFITLNSGCAGGNFVLTQLLWYVWQKLTKMKEASPKILWLQYDGLHFASFALCDLFSRIKRKHQPQHAVGLALLVYYGIFLEVHLCRLVVGHTHH
jgi:hypothetical protein